MSDVLISRLANCRSMAAGRLPVSDVETIDLAIAEIQRQRAALLVAQGALVQCSPCASLECQADQREWLEDAIAGCERALGPNV